MIFTRSFATASLERCFKAVAWSLSSLLIADGTGILNTAWADRLSVAGMAGLLSILGSVASSGVGGTGPSLANEVISPPAVDPGDAGHSTVEVVLISALVAIVVVVAYVLVR